MYNILLIADYVIDHGTKSGISITHLKLQKLLYYIKVWTLVAEQPIVNGSFAKWKFGPVNSDVYHEYKAFGASSLRAQLKATPFENKKDKELVDFILDNYEPFDALTLSTFTHRELPWLLAVSGDTINDEIVKKYYGEFLFAQNFPLSSTSNKYIPVNTEQDASYIFDMEDAFAHNVFKYSSFEDYTERISKAKKAAHKTLSDTIASFV